MKIRKYFELNDNKNTFQTQNAAKSMLRGKCVVRLKFNKLSSHCKN